WPRRTIWAGKRRSEPSADSLPVRLARHLGLGGSAHLHAPIRLARSLNRGGNFNGTFTPTPQNPKDKLSQDRGRIPIQRRPPHGRIVIAPSNTSTLAREPSRATI